MSNITTGGTTKEARLTDTVWRKIVMDHETAIVFSLQGFNTLGITLAAKSCCNHCLGLATGKECGTMRLRKIGNLAANGTYLVHGTTVNTDLLINNLGTHCLLLVA